MKRRVLGSLLAVPFVTAGLLSSTPQAGAVPEIIGGGTASETYGFMASMQDGSGLPNCGASLVAPQWLVTAAHCLADESPADWHYRIGSTDREHGGELRTPDRFIVHPKYDPVNTGDYDIGLVHLSEPASATPIRVATASPAPGTPVRVLGWGLTCGTRGCGGTPRTLRQMDTGIVADSSCTGKDGSFDPGRELCLDNKAGKRSTCYGDSGGPAMVFTDEGWALVGATSRGQTLDCPQRPGIFTDVTTYATWITDHTTTNSPQP